jgi:hypothetical protein
MIRSPPSSESSRSASFGGPVLNLADPEGDDDIRTPRVIADASSDRGTTIGP